MTTLIQPIDNAHSAESHNVFEYTPCLRFFFYAIRLSWKFFTVRPSCSPFEVQIYLSVRSWPDLSVVNLILIGGARSGGMDPEKLASATSSC